MTRELPSGGPAGFSAAPLRPLRCPLRWKVALYQSAHHSQTLPEVL